MKKSWDILGYFANIPKQINCRLISGIYLNMKKSWDKKNNNI